MRELVCIVCPKGCRLRVDEENDFAVTGNSCPRGREYAVSEMTDPVRTFSVSVRVTSGDRGAVAVRVSAPVNKKFIAPIARLARQMRLQAPVKAGETIATNAAQSGADLIAVASVPRA